MSHDKTKLGIGANVFLILNYFSRNHSKTRYSKGPNGLCIHRYMVTIDFAYDLKSITISKISRN